MKTLFVASAVASALLLIGCEDAEVTETENLASETEVSTTDPVLISAWDLNNDGLLQRAEYELWDQQGITDWDTDDDTMLSAEEFRVGWVGAGFSKPDEVFAEWDGDSDGFITNDEFFEVEEWTEWDANADGVLAEDEFAYY